MEEVETEKYLTERTRTESNRTAPYRVEEYKYMKLTTQHAHTVKVILTITFGLLAIAAGADKFMHILTNWNNYLAPVIANAIPFTVDSYMSVVGVIEIIAGILVFARPRFGSMVLCLWLLGIAANLFLTGQYYDIAVRDIVLAIGAFSLFLLSGRESRLMVKSN